MLLVYKASRLFRQAGKRYQFINEEVVEEGLRAVSVSQGIDTNDRKTWKLQLQIHGIMDDMLLDAIADHVRAGLTGLFLNNWTTGAIGIVLFVLFGFLAVEFFQSPDYPAAVFFSFAFVYAVIGLWLRRSPRGKLRKRHRRVFDIGCAVRIFLVASAELFPWVIGSDSKPNYVLAFALIWFSAIDLLLRKKGIKNGEDNAE